MPFVIDPGMKPSGKTESDLRLAVPCYGKRVLPRFGLARDFYLVDFDPRDRTLRAVQQLSWEPLNQPQLSRWLKTQGTWTVLCGGIHPRFQAALYAEGIGVVWGFRGEVEEVVKAWLQRFDPQDSLSNWQEILVQGYSEAFPNMQGGCPRHHTCEGDRS